MEYQNSSNAVLAPLCSLTLGGPLLTDVCRGGQLFVFLSILDSLIRVRPDIGDPCGRIRPVENPEDKYDFIVVGGGSAGAVVAGRLSEVPEWKVLLLEAGPDEPAGAEIPSMFTAFLKSSIDWDYRTTNEKFACLSTNGSCTWPRGKNLGGCSVHHGMMYHRGHPKNYDNWAARGNKGWTWKEVFPFFLKSEDNTETNIVGTKYHATGGPMPVQRYPWQPPLAWDILAAGDERGYGISEDLNGEKKIGFAVAQTNSRNGVRVSSAAAFLRPVRDRKNLNVALKAMATRVIIKNKQAVGVEYYMNGKLKTALATREVIVSGGSVNSPQLLLLSGIGPKNQLRSVNVPLVKHLPGVGKNLHNHVSYGVEFTLNEPEEQDLNLTTTKQYLDAHKGPLTSSGLAQVTAILASQYTTCDYPDIQLFYAGYQAACVSAGTDDLLLVKGKRTVRFTSVNVKPRSRGQLRLASKDPFEYPIIQGNDLKDPRDVNVLVEGLNIIMSLVNTTAMRKHNLTLKSTPLKQCSQFEYTSDDYWRCAVRQDTRTENHQSGSCKMGPASDRLAVVDPRLRVHGIKGLRVADASIMPQVVSGNPAGPITMIGERAADFIKKDWGV